MIKYVHFNFANSLIGDSIFKSCKHKQITWDSNRKQTDFHSLCGKRAVTDTRFNHNYFPLKIITSSFFVIVYNFSKCHPGKQCGF